QDLVRVRPHGGDDLGDQPFFVPGRDHHRHAGVVAQIGPVARRDYRRSLREILFWSGTRFRPSPFGEHHRARRVSLKRLPVPMSPVMSLARDVVRANLGASALPYKVTLVATYHCNFRCEMCNIWQKKSVGEMTPAEVAGFFDRWPQFSWVHLTGGELFMRRDLEDLVAAILDRDRSLYLLNFPTTGWFGDRTVAMVEEILRRGVGRLMTTISIDGPKEIHDRMRGLAGSWERGIETLRRLRLIRRRNFQVVAGMTLVAKNAALVDDTVAAIRRAVPGFERNDLHLNIGHESPHYFANAGSLAADAVDPVAAAIDAHRAHTRGRLHPVRFLEDRYQALVADYYR